MQTPLKPRSEEILNEIEHNLVLDGEALSDFALAALGELLIDAAEKNTKQAQCIGQMAQENRGSHDGCARVD